MADVKKQSLLLVMIMKRDANEGDYGHGDITRFSSQG
jgi:hypothetical protein